MFFSIIWIVLLKWGKIICPKNEHYITSFFPKNACPVPKKKSDFAHIFCFEETVASSNLFHALRCFLKMLTVANITFKIDFNLSAAWSITRVVKSALQMKQKINMVAIYKLFNLLASFCCVLAKDILR